MAECDTTVTLGPDVTAVMFGAWARRAGSLGGLATLPGAQLLPTRGVRRLLAS